MTTAQVAAWKEASLNQGVSARSVVRHLMVLSQVFTHAQGHHELDRNPASAAVVKRPRVPYDRSRF